MYMQRQPSYYQGQRPPYGGGYQGSVPALLGQVLGITGAGFLITAVAAYLFQGVPYGVGLICLIAGFVMLIAINGTRANPRVALLCFYGFTFLEGIGLAPTISAYVRTIGPGEVFEAAVTTGVGMFLLAAVAYTFSFDFRRLSGIAFGALMILVIAGIISIFTHFLHPATYAWFTLGVFSLLVLVDFARIRAGGGGLTPVQLATSIYLDAINIFLALLELFGMRARNND